MWIKRETFVYLTQDVARLGAEVESKKGQIERLDREIGYWKGKFEDAQDRADRLVDSSMKVSGLGPITNLGIKEVDEQREKYEKMMLEAQKQTKEMFSEDIPGPGELMIDPKLEAALLESLAKG